MGVHNQRQDCASCWAYVTTDILESLRVIKNFSRVHEELAVDELINCDTYDSGCATGNMFTAFEWIETEGGITTNHHFGSLLDGLSGKPKSWFANTLKTRGDEKDEADAYGVKPEALEEDDEGSLVENGVRHAVTERAKQLECA